MNAAIQIIFLPTASVLTAVIVMTIKTGCSCQYQTIANLVKKPRSISFTLEQLQTKPCADLNPDLFQEQEKIAKKRQKVSKYRNKKTEVDGIVFDSAKEPTRYKVLLLLLKAGEIGHLERQVPFELKEGGTHSLKYVADFVYIDARTGEKIIEDTKGHHTKEYLKRRLMKKVHGIEVIES